MTTRASAAPPPEERTCDDRAASRRHPSRRTDAGTALAIALCCVPIVVGSAVMLAGGAGVARCVSHLAIGVVGAALAVALAATLPPRRGSGIVVGVTAVVAVALTLLEPGLDGVRRWLVLGPLRVHASALVAPSLIVVAALDVARGGVRGFALLVALQIVHLLQPDAGQATAMAAAGAAIVLWPHPPRGAATAVLGIACVALGAVAWLRADPLLPVAFVEDVVARAAALSPVLGALCVLSLPCSVAAPLVIAFRCRQDTRVVIAGVALSAGLAGAIAASLLGAFPVPLLGFSPSAVLGMFIGVGALLSAVARTGDDRRDVGSSRSRCRQP